MTEGIKSKAKMTGLLEEELEALQRQRDQYALAMDTATEPKVAIRLQRTLERIEDEIEGVEETIAALPDSAEPDASTEPEADAEPEADSQPEAVAEPEADSEPEPNVEAQPEAEPEPEADAAGDAEWDDEPSTAIYDPDRVRTQLAELEAMRKREAEEEAAATEAPVPEPEAGGPPDEEPDPPASELDEVEEPSGEGNPLGPVWMDPVSPPAGNLSDDEIAEAAGSAPEPAPDEPTSPEPASPDVLGDDPFALPSKPAVAAAPESSSPFGAPAGDASPFGAAPSDAPFGSPAPSDFGNPVSVLDDDLNSSDWGFGAKAALFLVVAGFVAGAFYIMSIG